MAKQRSAKPVLALFPTPCFPIVIILLAALVFAPPIVVRYGLEHLFETYDIHADIGHVYANIFTGTVSLDHIAGHDAAGHAFQIGHLSARLSYRALTEHRLLVDKASIADTSIEIDRDKQGLFTLLGLSLPTDTQTSTGDWGFGINQLDVSNLTLYYSAAAQKRHAPAAEHFQINKLQVNQFATWRPDDPTGIHLQMAFMPGSLSLKGQLKPLATPLSGHLQLKANALPLGIFAPFVDHDHITRFAGNLTAHQQIDFHYDSQRGISARLNGDSQWEEGYFTTSGGTNAYAGSLSWTGKGHALIPWQQDKTGHITLTGQIGLTHVLAQRAGQFDFRQRQMQWQGQAETTLGPQQTLIATRGKITSRDTRLSSPQTLDLHSLSGILDGQLNLTLANTGTRIDINGKVHSDGLSCLIPDTLTFAGQPLDWHGKIHTTLTDRGLSNQAQGRLTGSDVNLSINDVTNITAKYINWLGTAQIDNTQSLSSKLNGGLAARQVTVGMPGQPFKFTANRFGFNGQYLSMYDDNPDTAGLAVHGSAYGDNLSMTDTTTGAAWFSTLFTNVSGLAINSLDDIGFGKLDASGIRLLGNADTNQPIIRAVKMHIDDFSLTGLQRYHVASIALLDALTNLHRNHHQLTTFRQFFPESTADDKKSDDDNSPTQPTFRIDHLHISGPALTYEDTSFTPAIQLQGTDIDLQVDHLDTGNPDSATDYKLSAGVGAFGHFDSIGTIEPFAPEGPNMTVKAWMRSLTLPPLSGYLNAAMDQQIDRGVADGTLKLSATKGDLDGVLDATLTHLHLFNDTGKEPRIGLGLSMNTVIGLLGGREDSLHFRTKVLGDITAPYFSIDDLIREAVLAGLHTALFSSISPVGILDRVTRFILNRFRLVSDRPAIFRDGMYYIQSDDRRYLARIAFALQNHPDWSLHTVSVATAADAKAMNLSGLSDQKRHEKLEKLARNRQRAVRDYIAARGAIPDQIVADQALVIDADDISPSVLFTLDRR